MVCLIKTGGKGEKQRSRKGSPAGSSVSLQPEIAEKHRRYHTEDHIDRNDDLHLHFRHQTGNQHIRPQQPVVGKVIGTAAGSQCNPLGKESAGGQHDLPQTVRHRHMLTVPVSQRPEEIAGSHGEEKQSGCDDRQQKIWRPQPSLKREAALSLCEFSGTFFRMFPGGFRRLLSKDDPLAGHKIADCHQHIDRHLHPHFRQMQPIHKNDHQCHIQRPGENPRPEKGGHLPKNCRQPAVLAAKHKGPVGYVSEDNRKQPGNGGGDRRGCPQQIRAAPETDQVYHRRPGSAHQIPEYFPICLIQTFQRFHLLSLPSCCLFLL